MKQKKQQLVQTAPGFAFGKEGAIDDTDIDMLGLNDNLKVYPMKIETVLSNRVERRPAGARHGRVLSEGVSVAMLAPAEEQIIQIATRPKTSQHPAAR